MEVCIDIYDLQRNMHQIQSSEATVICRWSLWYRTEKVPSMWRVYQVERWHLVSMLPR